MEIELVFPKKFGCVGAVDVPSLYFVVPVQVAQERLRVHRCFRFSVYTAYDVGSVYFFALQDGCVACIEAIVERGCFYCEAANECAHVGAVCRNVYCGEGVFDLCVRFAVCNEAAYVAARAGGSDATTCVRTVN